MNLKNKIIRWTGILTCGYSLYTMIKPAYYIFSGDFCMTVSMECLESEKYYMFGRAVGGIVLLGIGVLLINFSERKEK